MFLDTVSCPRCNAFARLSVAEHDKNSLSVAHIDCDKCKLHKFVGVLSKKEINFLKIQKKLKNLIELSQNEQEIAILEQKLKKLKEKEQKNT